MHPIRVSIPQDNSCMFNAIHHLMNAETGSELREIVASIILSNPDKYTDIYLGKEVDSYIEDIMNPDQWGGAIDLQILAEYYNIEIVSFNIETTIPVIYGEGQNYENRIYVIYNGFHYDTLVIDFGVDLESLRIFSSNEIEYFELFRDFTGIYTKKGEYLNLNKFLTKCQICGKKMLNSKEIQQHVNETGHSIFEEVKN